MEEIKYSGWFGVGTARCKCEIVIIGEVVRETPKQIVVFGNYKYYPEKENTFFTINKSKIINRKIIFHKVREKIENE